MGTSTIIAAFEMELAHTVSGMTTDTLNEKSGHIRKLLTILEAHQSVAKNIDANLSLSQQGRMDALRKLATSETAPALKWLRPEIAKLQEKDQHYHDQFFTVDSGIKDLAERMPIFVYLWDKFDVLDQSARVTQFLESAERDEVRVMAAMLENPLGAMVDENVKIAALTERAKRLTPQDVENFEQTQLLLEFLTMARDWIARWLNQEVGVGIAVLRTNLGDEVADALELVAK